MEAVATKTKIVATTFVKNFAATISIAAVYYWLCALTPAISSSWIGGFAGVSSLRIANVLRALVLTNPYTAIGTALGSQAFNISTGKAALGAYPVTATLVTLAGVLTWYMSQAWGRSVSKDLTLLAFYGFVSGTIVALHLTAFSMLLHGSVWGEMLQVAILWKIASTTAVVMLGYPLVRFFDNLRKSHNDGSE